MTYNVLRTPYYHQLASTTAKVVIEQGGTASGKTYTTLQVLFDILISQVNKVITVVGQDIPNLKKGAYRDAKRIWSEEEHLQALVSKPNESDRIFRCPHTGSIMEFTSYSDEQDAKSGKRDYLFVNEANGIPYAIYWQLAIRTKERVFIDYNPTLRFWAHDMMGAEGVVVFYTDHRNNPYLTDEQHARIENISDPELFRVYARGMTGAVSGLIYRKWEIVDAMPTEYKWRVIGIDFGYNDPTAILDIRFSDGCLYVDELCYKSDMIARDIAEECEKNNLKRERIIADSAGKSIIAELKKIYKYKVTPCVKGADSIVNGIKKCQGYQMRVTRRSHNVRRELENYKWMVDRNGVVMNEAEDKNNHAMDAMRYGVVVMTSSPTGSFRAIANT